MTKPAYTYDELDEIFRGKGDDDTVGMSLIDGLIAALVAGPVFVHPAEWLPLIFNGRVPNGLAGMPENLAVNTIFNRYNEVSAILADHPKAYRPIFMFDADHLVVDHWAVGFMRGITLRVQEWTEVLLTDMRLTLAPIFLSHDMGTGFLPDMPKAEQLRRRTTAHQHIADAVVALRQACNPKRSTSSKPAKTRRVRARRTDLP
ncbi:UPF0149 family protein [Reyranella sp.]|uniref:UPF0149 family protein n=1 Tax=Reyranella sp. TaxID=1929291 RepID=UPI004035DC53